MAKLQKLLIINSLSYRWSEMKIPGSESLAKLSQLQRLILVVLLEPRYSALKRREFRALIKGLYWGFGYPGAAAAAVSLSRALSRLEERGYIVRRFPGCWELTCSESDFVRNGWLLALCSTRNWVSAVRAGKASGSQSPQRQKDRESRSNCTFKKTKALLVGIWFHRRRVPVAPMLKKR